MDTTKLVPPLKGLFEEIESRAVKSEQRIERQEEQINKLKKQMKQVRKALEYSIVEIKE